MADKKVKFINQEDAIKLMDKSKEVETGIKPRSRQEIINTMYGKSGDK